jgi:hypothetical protein
MVNNIQKKEKKLDCSLSQNLSRVDKVKVVDRKPIITIKKEENNSSTDLLKLMRGCKCCKVEAMLLDSQE